MNDIPSSPNGRNICPRCGSAFSCGMAAGDAKCWCADLPPQLPDPAVTGCLCPACLKAVIAQRSAPASG